MKYTARHAWDNPTEPALVLPLWMIWNGHVNVTGKVMMAMYYPWKHGSIFMWKEHAEKYAQLANELKLEV
jgi:hypothetical protein